MRFDDFDRGFGDVVKQDLATFELGGGSVELGAGEELAGALDTPVNEHQSHEIVSIHL